MRRWDVSGGREVWRGACPAAVSALCVAPGSVLAAAGAGVRRLDARAGHLAAALGGGAGAPVAALALDGDHLLYAAVADKIHLWDLRMCVYIMSTRTTVLYFF